VISLFTAGCSNDPFVRIVPIFDYFSDPASGWFVGEDNRKLAEYLDGE
jgi:hypothetical protein